VIICEIILHLLVIAQNYKRYTVQVLKQSSESFCGCWQGRTQPLEFHRFNEHFPKYMEIRYEEHDQKVHVKYM